MAKNGATISDDKITFFQEQLYRELSHMFKWEGLPATVPHDYLERTLIRSGNVLFYEDENIGHDILEASVLGFNRHNMPTSARATVMDTSGQVTMPVERKVKRLSDSKKAVEQFDPTTDGVLIRNREDGESMQSIVEHYATRLAMAQQAFDTSLLWANVPYIFQVSSEEVKLSIEKLVSDISSGKPFVIVDKYLLADNKDRAGIPGVTYIGKEIMDTINEIKMKFRQDVGIRTAGVDKAERANVEEVTSNDQHTKTVLQIMLEQREIACENINAFFGLNMSVSVIGNEHQDQEEDEEELEEGEEENGTDDSGTKGPTQD